MPTATELRAERCAIIAKSRQLVDAAGAANRDMSAEENQQFDRMIADADKLNTQIRSAEQREWVEAEEAAQRSSQGRRVPAGQTRDTEEVSDHDRRESIRAWALQGTDRGRADADNLHRAARCGINLHSQGLNLLGLRSLSKGTNAAGGFTVPTNFASEIEKALKFYAPIREYARSLKTDAGADLVYPKVTDVANSATIVAEAGAIAAATDPVFANVTMKAWKYATTIVKVSIELLADSAVNVEQLLGQLLGERMGRGQATHFVTGDGTTQPQGVVTFASAANQLAASNPMTGDKIIDLIYSLDRAYRQGATFVMHDDTVASIVKLKDTTNQYLWQPGFQVGEPDRLKGYPVIVSNDMNSIVGVGSNLPLIVFGNMQRYLIRDVIGSQQVTRLNELYAATGEVGFVLLQRCDGRVIGHTGCFKTLNSVT